MSAIRWCGEGCCSSEGDAVLDGGEVESAGHAEGVPAPWAEVDIEQFVLGVSRIKFEFDFEHA